MTKKISSILKYILIVTVGIMFVSLLIKLVPWFFSFSDPAIREEFKEYIASLGIKGVFYLLGLQILQIIVAILPGESIELLAGIIYGTWGGLLICMVGIFIGTSIIFFTVRRFGKNFVEELFTREKIQGLSFLHNRKKLELIIFILYFIPGTPKDILTYIAPLTKIKASHFLLISFFARLPSVITSTYAGETLTDGKWLHTIVIFLVMGAIGIGGILVYNNYINQNEKEKN